MKKLLSLIISAVIVAALAIGIIIGVKSYQDNKEYSLTASTTVGGIVDINIDNNPYIVEPNAALSFTVKKKSKITLTATADEGSSFINWQLNGADYSTQPVIDLTVSQESNIKAIFGVKSVNVTVTDTDFSETFAVSSTDNLLQALTTKFTAPAGYNYIYKINGTEVTAETTIAEATTITREKVLINYTVTFKHNDTQVGEVLTYTVENKTIVAPAVPVEQGYTIVWETYSLDNLGNIVVNSIKTPITYTIKYTLPAGYTFDGTATEVERVYTIENYNVSNNKFVESRPSLPTARDGYELTWEDVVLTFDNITTANTITAVENIVTYTVTFKHNGEQVGQVQTYTIENKTTVTTPAVPSETGYIVVWDTYTLDNLGDLVVNTVKTPIEYTITYVLPNGFTFEDGTTSVSKIYYITNDTTNVEKPSFEDIVVEDHYELTFPEFTLTYDETTPVVVNIVKTPINYVVTFKNGETVVATETYTVENKTITVPEIPDLAHYENEAWEAYDLNSLTDITVNLTKTATVYTVTFKNEDDVVGTDTYTIEDKSVTAPEVPDVPYYSNERWPTVEFPEELGNFDVQLKKVMTQYFITYKLPDGYTFADSSPIAISTFTILDYNETDGKFDETRPTLPTPKDGYTLAWEDVTLTLANIETVTEIKVIESLVTYKAEFKHNGAVLTTIEYNVTTINSVVSPATPIESGYLVKWEPYKITKENIGDIVINSVKLVQVRIEYVIDEFAIAYDYTDRNYTTVYVAIDSESNVVTDGTNPIIYKLNPTDTKQVQVRTDLISTITNAVNNPSDATDIPVITKLELVKDSTSQSSVNLNNDLETQFNTMLPSCNASGYTIKVTYEDPSVE